MGAAQYSKSWHLCEACKFCHKKLLVSAEKAFDCLQIGVKRGERQGPAYHQAKPSAQKSGRQVADLAGAGGNGKDAVLFLGSQGALLGAVQVRICAYVRGSHPLQLLQSCLKAFH